MELLIRAMGDDQPTRLRRFYLLDQIGEVCACGRHDQTLFYRLADRADVKMLRRVALTGIEAE